MSDRVPVGNTFARVTPGDHETLSAFTWHLDDKGYPTRNLHVAIGQRRPIRMHQMVKPVVGGQEVDHINRDPLDNRRCNLRVATHAQNAVNRDYSSVNTSGYRGVSRTNWGPWRAQVEFNGKKHYLGSFDDAVEAALAYDLAAIKTHGEFAVTNFLKWELCDG